MAAEELWLRASWLLRWPGLLGMVAHTLMPTLLKQKQADACESEARLICTVNSRTARTTP